MDFVLVSKNSLSLDVCCSEIRFMSFCKCMNVIGCGRHMELLFVIDVFI